MKMTPKRTPTVCSRMRPYRRDHRGLAEIVGTLMLVVIVVAAATAFSFFVAAYQKQLQSEETLTHDKALEDLRILALSPTLATDTSYISTLKVEVASLDPNAITIDGMVLNGNAVVSYGLANLSGTSWPYGCLNGPALATPNTACVLTIPADAEFFLVLNLTPGTMASISGPAYAYGTGPNTPPALTESGLLEFQLYTSLGNEFTQSFVPPVALAQVSFVGSFPILDGSSSYQPSGGTANNVTIDQWAWNVVAPPVENSPMSLAVGAADEWGELTFTVTSGYTPSPSETISDLSFTPDSASGSVTSGSIMILSTDLTNPTTDVVTFSFTYTATSSGVLVLAGGSLSDSGSSPTLSDTPSIASSYDVGVYSGQEVELTNYLSSNVPYDISLVVTNSESLVGSTSITYTLS